MSLSRGNFWWIAPRRKLLLYSPYPILPLQYLEYISGMFRIAWKEKADTPKVKFAMHDPSRLGHRSLRTPFHKLPLPYFCWMFKSGPAMQ